MFLLVAAVLVALAVSSVWLQKVAFTPSADTGTAKAVLGNEDIRTEIATLIASADAPLLNQSSAQLKEYIEQSMTYEAGAALMTDIVRDAHERVIGDRTRPVRVSPAEQVVIVRNELVANEPAITLPVKTVNSLSIIKSMIEWVWKIAAGLALLLLIAGLIMRPEPGEFTLALSVAFGALGILFPIFGWLIPAAFLPTLSDDTWTGLFARLANDSLRVTLFVSVASLVIAGAIALRTGGSRQRRQRSTPLSVGRYRDQRWSR